MRSWQPVVVQYVRNVTMPFLFSLDVLDAYDI